MQPELARGERGDLEVVELEGDVGAGAHEHGLHEDHVAHRGDESCRGRVNLGVQCMSVVEGIACVPLTTKAGMYCTMRVRRKRPSRNQQAAKRRVDTA
jgi:hypothetical protein